MFKRMALIFLCLLMVIQSLPAWALDLGDYNTEEELRRAVIGDEKWVEQFPGGLFNFLGTQFEVGEANEFLEIPIVRQGGTQGRVTVDFKAIDISAKYGEDYVIRIYGNAEKNEIKRYDEAISLIEGVSTGSAINISESAAEEEAAAEHGAGSTPEQKPGDEAQSPADVPAANNDGTRQDIVCANLPEPDVSIDSQSKNQVRSLRRAREVFLGEESDRPDWKTADLKTVEELKTQYDEFLSDMPGTGTTLEFEDGEYIKYLYLVPLNDSLSESDEQLMMALTNPEGASRGEFYMAYINVTDDEKPEKSVFEIVSPLVEAEGETAAVTVRRTGGLHQYASVIVGTVSGTAISGTDYEPGLSRLFFTPGMEEQKAIINVYLNPERKTDKQFIVALDGTDGNVNSEKAEAIIILPAKSDGKISKLTLSTDAEAQNINAELLTAYGYSSEKGTWTVTGEDFINNGSLAFPKGHMPSVKGNGLYYAYKSTDPSKESQSQSTAYDFNSLGGVESVSFKYLNDAEGTDSVYAQGHLTLSYTRNNTLFLGMDYIYGLTGRASDVKSFSSQSLNDDKWLLKSRISLDTYSPKTGCLTKPYFFDITLHLKEYNAKILPPQNLQRKKYTIADGMLSKEKLYTEYTPGRLYVKAVYSNAGNYQDKPADPGLYRSDRVVFGYEYGIGNPGGRYARYSGFEIKNGNTWIPFKGEELILNSDFFKKPGVFNAIKNGTVEIRPIFEIRPAGLKIDFDDGGNGWLKNAPEEGANSTVDKNRYMEFAAPLNVGDVIEGLEAKAYFAARTPVWNSRSAAVSGVGSSYDSTSQSVVITEADAETKIDYHIEDVSNELLLKFKNTDLIVESQPNIYKSSITQPSYKLDGVSYTREKFMEEMERVYGITGDGEPLPPPVNGNPLLEMEFSYVFNPSFPDPGGLKKREFGEPQRAELRVYKNNGALRYDSQNKPCIYTIDCHDGNFKFSARPTELGWELEDFATVIVQGNAEDGTQIPQTQETVIDFLANSGDGIFVSPPEGEDTQPIWAGNIQNPITVKNVNPMKYYGIQSITSPGFASKWMDASPDLDGDGQISTAERNAMQQKILALKYNVDAWDENIYWGNYFSYRPGFFNPSKIYYSFEKMSSGTEKWNVEFSLYELFGTVLNPALKSNKIPIADAEVYVGTKRVYDKAAGDETADGTYIDTDYFYKNGNLYQGQLFYRGGIYNFAAKGGFAQECRFYTSDVMRPYDFKAVVRKGSKEERPKLDAVNTEIFIDDALTTFSYRLDGSVAGVRANDSIIRIYTDSSYTESVFEKRTGEPLGDEFSYTMNLYEENIKPGCTMTISGLLTNTDGAVIGQYPEVRVGLVFSQKIDALTALASFSTPLQPDVKMLGKLSNKYDLNMNVNLMNAGAEIYTDDEGIQRKRKTVSVGFSSEYVKKFKDNAKVKKAKDGDTDTDTDSGGNAEALKKELDKKDKDGLEKEADKAAGDTKPAAKNSGGGDFKMPYEISLLLTLELGQKYDEATGLYTDDGFHYFSSLVIMATANAKYEKSNTFMTPVGLPVKVTLSAGGGAAAVLGIEADHSAPYNKVYRLDGKGNISANPLNHDVYAKFILKPFVELSAGSGFDNIDLTVSGRADFDFTFNMPIVGDAISSSGNGGLTISANLKIKILFVQKKWTLYKSKRIELFSYGAGGMLYNVLNDPYTDYLYESVGAISDEDIMSRDYLSQKGDWNNPDDDGLPQGVKSGSENVLQTGSFPSPQTKMIKLRDGRVLLLFIEDDTARDVRNRASLHYSVIDGENATVPAAIDPDGTWDQDPDVFCIEDKILITWSDSGRAFTAKDTQTDILSQMNISCAWFDPETLTAGEPFDITRTVEGGDRYADLGPKISYDSGTKRLMVYYTKIDYADRWEGGQMISQPEIPYDASPQPLYGDLVNGYSAIAYRYAHYDGDTGQFVWNEDYELEEGLESEKFYGQRFLKLAPLADIEETEYQTEDGPTTIPQTATLQVLKPYTGLSDPRVTSTDLITHDGRAVFAYVLDRDSDLKTQHDQQLFIQTYSYEDDTFSYPIEIANNVMQDTNPEFMRVGGNILLFWLRGGELVYTNISSLLAGGIKEVLDTVSREPFYIIDKSLTSRDAHILTAISHDSPIDEYHVVSDGSSIYALWTEDAISGRDGLKLTEAGADDPNNINRERHIFAACSAGSEEGSYPWSKPVQITHDEGQSFSDLSFVLNSDRVLTAAYSRYIQKYDRSAGCFTDSDSVHTLAVNTFTITSDLEIGEISVNENYPKSGQMVDVSASVKNTGLLPSEEYTTQLYVTVDEEVYYQQTEDAHSSNILGGGLEIIQGSFVMPEELDGIREIKAGFCIKNKSGKQLDCKEKEISIGPSLQIYVMESMLTGYDSANVVLYAENNGNKPFDNTLTISSEKQMLYEQPIVLKAGEAQMIPLKLRIDAAMFGKIMTCDDGSKFDILPLSFKFGKFEASGELKRAVSAKAFLELENVESFKVKKNGVELKDGSVLNMKLNDIISLKAEPVKKNPRAEGIVTQLETVWSSSKPDVLSVLRDGTLIPMSSGTASITASLQPTIDNVASFEDGTFEIVRRPYMVPEGVKNKISFTVNTSSSHSSGSSVTSPIDEQPDRLHVDGSIQAIENYEGDKLILTLHENDFAEAAAGVNNTLTIESLESPQANRVEIILTPENLKAIEKSRIKRLEIISSAGSICLDRRALNAILDESSGKSAAIELNIRGRSIEVYVRSEERSIQSLRGGFALVSAPYSPEPNEDINGILIYRIDDTETARLLKFSFYDAETGKIIFKTGDLGRLSIGYSKTEFYDDLGWAEPYITFLSSRNITVGTAEGIFDKDKIVTRAEFVTMLSRLEDLPLPEASAQFTDVPDNEWYARPVQWAFENGIVRGTGEREFSPYNAIRREEIAAIMHRYMSYMQLSVVQEKGEAFKDEELFSNWAAESIHAMKASDIMAGTGANTFEPKKLSSRAEAAKVITQIIKFLLK